MGRKAVLSGLLLVLGGCGDVPLPPESECVEGEAHCVGDLIVTCTQGTDQAWRWTDAEPCSQQGATCQQGVCAADCGVCDQPPNSCHANPGDCWNGQCNYKQKPDGDPCDDGDACTIDDGCGSGICQGRPMVCTTPPQNTCTDDKTLTVYSPVGLCQAGSCDYPASEVACPMGCESGVCKGNPCQDVTCDQPPDACYKQTGTCSQGQCFYYYDDGKTCDDGDSCTIADKCLGGKCGGTQKVCNSPPAASCKDSNTVQTYESQGTCQGGSCSYQPKTVTCSHGCDTSTGACKLDPCANVTCTSPPNGCYQSSGTCTDGNCSYDFDDGKTCNDGDSCTTSDNCSSGTCKGSQITCNTAPPNECKDANTLTVYTAPGTCSGGTCTYGSADLTCQFGCDAANAVCTGDPCASVTCDSPPNAACYVVPGLCSAGTCTYLPKSGDPCNDSNPCTRDDVCNSSGACNGTAYTCDDNLTCTTDTCNGSGGCSYPLTSGHCLIIDESGGPFPPFGQPTCYAANDANPNNACQYCDPQTSTSQWQQSSGTSLVTWTFDSGGGTLDGFTITPSPATSPSKWQIDTYRKVSGTHSLYFGNVTTRSYDNPGETVSGEATSPSVSLPSGSGKLCLTFMFWADTEDSPMWDYVELTVVGNTAVLWDSRYHGTTNGQWIPIAVDVSAHAGQSVQFKFTFDTDDPIINDFEGVYLDDIGVETNCSP